MGATTALSSCAGFSAPSSSSGSNELTFTTWASETEEAGFQAAVTAFQEANSGVTVNLNVVPYEQMFTGIDAQLSSNTAPDIFRVDYGNLGVYSSQEQLLDLSDYIDSDAADAFVPALWQAVQFDGTPYGVPHQTDTSAIVYNIATMEAAGITDIPTTLDAAWTWEQLAEVLTRLRASMSAETFPFVYNWQLGGAPRWFSWLFGADGRFLEDDLVTPAIESDAGAAALDYTKRFFSERWVPENSSVKSSSYADTIWTAGTTAMAAVGSFLIPDLDNLAEFEWGATYLPQNTRNAADLGGNALVATRSSANPELAAAFLAFMVQEDQMSAFCAATNELPTLTALVDSDVPYVVRPDVMPVFVEQATTIEPTDVEQLTVPFAAAVSTALQDQLELAFVNGQDTDTTLAGIAAAITQAAS